MHEEDKDRGRGRTRKYPRQLTIRVSEEMYQAIIAEAERDGLDPADIVRRALRRGMGPDSQVAQHPPQL